MFSSIIVALVLIVLAFAISRVIKRENIFLHRLAVVLNLLHLFVTIYQILSLQAPPFGFLIFLIAIPLLNIIWALFNNQLRGWTKECLRIFSIIGNGVWLVGGSFLFMFSIAFSQGPIVLSRAIPIVLFMVVTPILSLVISFSKKTADVNQNGAKR